MKRNLYKTYSYQMLKVLEKSFQDDLKDSTKTNREKANIKTELNKVQEAMKTK